MTSLRKRGGPVLKALGLSKRFPGVQALENVDLLLEAGKVHVLVGENGAGKSTLMRVMSGLEQPDGGAILYKNEKVCMEGPNQALRLGISMIHQELLPFLEMTVAENILIGFEPESVPGWVDHRTMKQRAESILRRLGADFSVMQKMSELGLAEVQTVEIARALAQQAEILIMDEPTSALSAFEVDVLFSVIRELKRQGVAIVYTSHKLDEVFEIGDTFTVLRDGRNVGTYPVDGVSEDRLISLMVGREFKATVHSQTRSNDKIMLSVHGLGRTGEFRDVSFEVRAGEILGVAGLMGAGRTALVNTVFGLARAECGQIRIRGRAVEIRSPREAIRHGIGLVSEDRKQYGLIPTLSVLQNLTLANLIACCRRGLLSSDEELRIGERLVRDFGIKVVDLEQEVEFLSGGNQQKVVFAKTLLTEPDILLLDEPTRGIDIAAKAEMHDLIRSLAQQGKAVVLVSSELPEVLSLSHRLLIMRRGRIVAEEDPRSVTQEEVLQYAMVNRGGYAESRNGN